MYKYLFFILFSLYISKTWAQEKTQIALHTFEQESCMGVSPKPDTIWAKNIRTQEILLVHREAEYGDHNTYYFWLDSTETYEVMVQKKGYYDVHFTMNLAQKEYKILENTEKVWVHSEGLDEKGIFRLEIIMNSSAFKYVMTGVSFYFKNNKTKIYINGAIALKRLFYNLEKDTKTKILFGVYISNKEKQKNNLLKKRKENIKKWFAKRGIPPEKIGFSKEQTQVDMPSYMDLMTVRDFPTQ